MSVLHTEVPPSDRDAGRVLIHLALLQKDELPFNQMAVGKSRIITGFQGD